ncbi:hypothetical protein ABW20_dc0109569 [Dactylellina cionopaga]|nr:hypothetical protein ABW20_dc0109569 [Dactylellina cionopaga]
MKIRILYSLIFIAICHALVSIPQPAIDKRALQQQETTRSNYDGLKSLFLHRRQSDGPDSARAEGGHGGRRTVKTTPAQRRAFRIAHGTVMAVAFTIGFPLGAIFIRVLKPPGHVYIHAGAQLISTSLAFTGLGLGVWLGLNTRYLDYAHTIIGMAVVASLVIQPVIGLIHHLRYKKVLRPTWWGIAHRWFGRTIVIVGIVNGGLGLLLAENTKVGEIVYAVVAGVAGLVWFTVVVVVAWRARKTSKASKKVDGTKMEMAPLM